MKNKPRDAVVIRVPTHPGGPVCNIDQLVQKLPRVFDPNLSEGGAMPLAVSHAPQSC